MCGLQIVPVGLCLGVSRKRPGNAPRGRDPLLVLQSLPDYIVPTDGVACTCVVGTEAGRVFLGSRDGHVYELLYGPGSASPWTRPCRRVCLTSSFVGSVARYVGALSPTICGQVAFGPHSQDP